MNNHWQTCHHDRENSKIVTLTVMSLQVNLASKDIAIAYQSVLDGTDTDWMLLTYDKGSNDLKVRSLR